MAWTAEEERFLALNYPERGKRWCAEKLGRSDGQIRSKASYMKIYQDTESDFFKDWQRRAAQAKIGKKRPAQAEVIKQLHRDGKFIKTPKQRAATGKRMKKWMANNEHPRGMLGKKHTPEMKMQMAITSKRNWEKMSDEQRYIRNRKILTTRHAKGTYASPRPKASWKAAWREIGGKRRYFRSRWEANYARYLEFLKINGQIKEWLHEPDVFWFEGIKRGCVSYLPDFKITNNNDSIEYHEVKGWMDSRSKTKIKRMAIYHPDVKLVVIAKKEYDEIRKKIGLSLSGWE